MTFIEKNRESHEKEVKDLWHEINNLQKKIGSYCVGYQTVEPLTVGLFGEWGSGKTHLLKGLQSYFITRLEDSKEYWESTPDKPKPLPSEAMIIPIFFNAWRFEKEEHIIIPLFKTLLYELEHYDTSSYIQKVRTKVKVLLMALLAGLQMPQGGIDTLLSLFTGETEELMNVSKFFNWKKFSKTKKKIEKSNDLNHQLKTLLHSERIESIYLHIPEWLEKITIFDNVRFVFLIDDLDRCLPENTLKMLESIKLFLDVPGCSFVLAVDDDVVERGVEHHYRDYLKRNDNHIYIQMPSKEDANHNNPSNPNSQERQYPHPTSTPNTLEKHHTLPITGHEYLEKMIQLPFRIPSLDTLDTRTFLKENYQELLEVQSHNRDIYSSDESKTEINEELLDFFVKTIPPSPRKLIRTMNLFQSKIELHARLQLPDDRLLLAKLTLLELFAPKLFRFMKNSDPQLISQRLIEWKRDAEIQYLTETEKIAQWISKSQLPQKERDRYEKLLTIIHELHQHRVSLNLDEIFQDIDASTLESFIKLKNRSQAPKKPAYVKASATPTAPYDLQEFFDYLFSDDPLLWSQAFKQDHNLSKENTVLDPSTFEALLSKAKEKFTDDQPINPKWLSIVGEHLHDEDFITLLKELNPIERFVSEK